MVAAAAMGVATCITAAFGGFLYVTVRFVTGSGSVRVFNMYFSRILTINCNQMQELSERLSRAGKGLHVSTQEVGAAGKVGSSCCCLCFPG